MASIRIEANDNNLLLATATANNTGAGFEEKGRWIVISDSPELTISRRDFDGAFDPDGQRARRGDSRLGRTWRSLLLNIQGSLRYFGDDEIVISDEKPEENEGRFPSLLQFQSEEEKAKCRCGFRCGWRLLLSDRQFFDLFFEAEGKLIMWCPECGADLYDPGNTSVIV